MNFSLALKRSVITTTLILSAGLIHGSAMAEPMDKETDSLLIQKLERVLEVMDNDSGKRVDVQLRLADLYAERARLEEVENGAKEGDEESQPAKDDRKRALELYQSNLAQSSGEVRGKITFQMAQLQDLQGKHVEAQALYLKVAQDKDKKFPPSVVGEAYTKLGDTSFNKVKFDEAIKYFNKALAIPETPRRNYIKYRLAWCDFHNGNSTRATNSLSKILQEEAAVGGNVSFREEASRDLATFMARGNVGPNQIQTLNEVSPVGARRDNLIYLSDELNRLGKKGMAVYVLTMAGSEEKSGDKSKDLPSERIDEHLKLAELQYDIGKKDQVDVELANTVNQWKSETCKVDENCELLKERFKKLVVAWGKAEEKSPTPALIKAYALYNSLFSEPEMNYWAALAARKVGMYKEAAQFYRTAATLALDQAKHTPTGKVQAGDKTQNILEGSLLGEIEVAEINHDLVMRNEAYNHYLSIHPQGQKSLEVNYQKAHLLYEQEKYVEAAQVFRAIALMKTTGKDAKDLREKSADLALDSLVLAKNEDLLQPWATEFAQEFPDHHINYFNIAKKAVINHVARIIDNPDSSPSELQDALKRLNTFPIAQATKDEQIAYYKNKLIIAERLQDLGEAKRAVIGLLAIKKLPETDREYALSREEWIDELTLNFKEAYALAVKLPLGHIAADERELKLSMLAELSGHNPEPHYIEYLHISKDREKSQGVIAKLIRRSQSRKLFNEYENRLRSNPELLTTLALEIFARHPDYDLAKLVLRVPGASRTSSGAVLSRFVFLRDFHGLSEELTASRLNHHSDRDLKSSLDHRVALLKKSESVVSRAVESQDWILQVIALNDVAYHYKRFAVELMGLPSPRGLNSNQRLQYREIVLRQARGYQAKSNEVMTKITELWNDSSTVDSLISDLQKTHGDLHKALFQELKIVARVAPVSQRHSFMKNLATAEERPSTQSLAAARNSVSQNPFNSDKIESLKSLEEKAGSETLVAFLDARLLQLGAKK